MDAQKYALAFVAVSIAWSTAVAARRAAGRPHVGGTWPAIALLAVGALVLLAHPDRMPLLLALPLLLVVAPGRVAVEMAEPAVALVRGTLAARRETLPDEAALAALEQRTRLETEIRALADALHERRITADEWRAAVARLAEELAAA